MWNFGQQWGFYEVGSRGDMSLGPISPSDAFMRRENETMWGRSMEPFDEQREENESQVNTNDEEKVEKTDQMNEEKTE